MCFQYVLNTLYAAIKKCREMLYFFIDLTVLTDVIYIILNIPSTHTHTEAFKC